MPILIVFLLLALLMVMFGVVFIHKWDFIKNHSLKAFYNILLCIGFLFSMFSLWLILSLVMELEIENITKHEIFLIKPSDGNNVQLFMDNKQFKNANTMFHGIIPENTMVQKTEYKQYSFGINYFISPKYNLIKKD